MSLMFTVDTSIPLVRVHGTGALNLNDMSMLSDDLARAGVYTVPRLVDMRDATLHIAATQIQAYVPVLARYRKAHGAVQVAVVVTDPATYGLLRMYQILSSEQNPGFGVFRTMEEGLDWLQLGALSSLIRA